jgi:hypothetical protein
MWMVDWRLTAMQAEQPFIPSPEDKSQRTIDRKFQEAMGLNL